MIDQSKCNGGKSILSLLTIITPPQYFFHIRVFTPRCLFTLQDFLHNSFVFHFCYRTVDTFYLPKAMPNNKFALKFVSTRPTALDADSIQFRRREAWKLFAKFSASASDCSWDCSFISWDYLFKLTNKYIISPVSKPLPPGREIWPRPLRSKMMRITGLLRPGSGGAFGFSGSVISARLRRKIRPAPSERTTVHYCPLLSTTVH